MPAFCNQFAELNSGLVLVAGPAASGRSTTISTFAETIAANRDVYIQTIEKPIERVLQNPRGAIAQREVGLHVRSGIEGVELAMQSGADVILFDYLENLEELSMLLRASNAGALVFAVTAGNNIHALLSRLLSSVSAEKRTAFANSLAEQLKGIIVQHLIPIVQNQGQVLAVEAAKMNSTMANMLRRGEISQLSASISRKIRAFRSTIRCRNAWNRVISKVPKRGNALATAVVLPLTGCRTKGMLWLQKLNLC